MWFVWCSHNCTLSGTFLISSMATGRVRTRHFTRPHGRWYPNSAKECIFSKISQIEYHYNSTVIYRAVINGSMLFKSNIYRLQEWYDVLGVNLSGLVGDLLLNREAKAGFGSKRPSAQLVTKRIVSTDRYPCRGQIVLASLCFSQNVEFQFNSEHWYLFLPLTELPRSKTCFWAVTQDFFSFDCFHAFGLHDGHAFFW